MQLRLRLRSHQTATLNDRPDYDHKASRIIARSSNRPHFSSSTLLRVCLSDRYHVTRYLSDKLTEITISSASDLSVDLDISVKISH